MLEQSYKALMHCGTFVDERLLEKGIYSTITPNLRKWNSTMDDITKVFKDYEHYIGGENYNLPKVLENLSKCELVEIRSFIGDNAKTYCDDLIATSKASPYTKELVELLDVCSKSLATYGSHPIIESQIKSLLSKIAGW